MVTQDAFEMHTDARYELQSASVISRHNLDFSGVWISWSERRGQTPTDVKNQSSVRRTARDFNYKQWVRNYRELFPVLSPPSNFPNLVLLEANM